MMRKDHAIHGKEVFRNCFFEQFFGIFTYCICTEGVKNETSQSSNEKWCTCMAVRAGIVADMKVY